MGHSTFLKSAWRFSVLIPTVMMVAFVAAPPANAASGDLDPTFGTGGKVTTDIGASRWDNASGVAIQQDGGVVAAGWTGPGGANDFALTRYNTDGTLDTTFGECADAECTSRTGKVTTNFVNLGFERSDDRAFDVAIQATDGKIVAAGQSTDDFALARYHTDGTLDTGFGAGGQVVTHFGASSGIDGVAIQDNGRIVAAGHVAVLNGGTDSALARYTANGVLDPTFGNLGTVTTDFSAGSQDYARDLAIQEDGKIVTAGTGGSDDFALARYNPDGTLDQDFGEEGRVLTDFGRSLEAASGLAIQADGNIVAAGSADSGVSSDFALVRYTTDGNLDHTFGEGGKVLTDFANSMDFAGDVAIQEDDKIVAAGNANLEDFALVRYTTTGRLDKTFGRKGKVTTDFEDFDAARDVAIQQDGKIIAAGRGGAVGDFALARYLP